MKKHINIAARTGAKNRTADLYKAAVEACPNQIDRFVDGCAGAGNITAVMRGHDYNEYIVNEFDPEMSNIYSCLSDVKTRRAVIEGLLELDLTEETFNKCREYLLNKKISKEKVEYAVKALFVRNLAYNGTGYAVGRKGNIDYKKCLYNKVRGFELFDGIHTLNVDVLSLLKMELADKSKMERTFYFLDPPYLDARPKYCNDKTATKEAFHIELCKLARQLKNVLICGYDSRLYEEELVQYGFYKYSMGMRALSCQRVERGGHRKYQEEIIWTSYPIPELE